MTFSVPTTSVYGLGDVSTLAEYTSTPVANAYEEGLQALMDYVNQANQTVGGGAALTYQQSLDAILALRQLKNLVQYGVLIDNTTGQVTTLDHAPTDAELVGKTRSFVTMTMAQNFDLLSRSFAGAGFDINGPIPSGAGDVNNWQYMVNWGITAAQVTTIQNILASGTTEAKTADKTLQGMIQLDYVVTGSQTITQQMTNLNNALGTTADVLAILTDMQNMRNQVTFIQSGFRNPDYYRLALGGSQPGDGHGPSAWADGYNNDTLDYFDQPIFPVLPNGVITYDTFPNGTSMFGRTNIFSPNPGPNFASAFNQLLSIRDRLQTELTQLQGQASAGDLSNPNSLYSRVKSILDDLRAVGVADNMTAQSSYGTVAGSRPEFDAYVKWMTDSYASYNGTSTLYPTGWFGQSAADQGKFQQNLTFGLTAAENLNDTQKENVRNLVYIFQEFYKSASSALQAISQMIQKMAQNIAR